MGAPVGSSLSIRLDWKVGENPYLFQLMYLAGLMH